MTFATKKTFLLLVALIIGFSSCKEGNSIYNPDYEPKPDPVITSITPEDGYLAGVDSIIIHGENFSDDVDAITVDFDGEPGIVLSATPTKIGVRPAQVEGDSIPVRVSSRGALNFSNTMMYKLDGAIFPIPGYNQTHNTSGITRNSAGDIIYSLANENGAARGIKIWKTDGTIEDYIPSSLNWFAMKVGPDGLIYAVRDIYAVYRETAEGVIDVNPFAIGNSSEAYRNLDFGPDEYLWVVGNNENIIRVDISDGSINRFPFTANLRAVRYYDGQLFVGGSFTDGDQITQQVWSFDIVNNELENASRVFTVEDEVSESMQIMDITFDVEGRMYIGTSSGSGVYTWDSKGYNEMYPGLIKANGAALTWLENYLVASITNLGATTRHPTKIDIRKDGAPYLGTD